MLEDLPNYDYWLDALMISRGMATNSLGKSYVLEVYWTKETGTAAI